MRQPSRYERCRTIVVAVLALCVGMLFAWIFPLPQLSAIKHGPLHGTSVRGSEQAEIAPSTEELQILVQYLPKHRVESGADGKKHLISETGNAVLGVPVKEVALVLVDTWGGPDEPDEPDTIRRNQKGLLEECRKHGVTVIHAPNHPVVDKYAQYHHLRAEVESFVAQFRVAPQNPPPFLDWPLPNNKTWLQAQRIRSAGTAAAYELHPTSERDISRHLTPLSDEYVLSSHMEFRYVLWRERIKLLLYAGGALNECMQHRDTGINSLAGIDSTRVPITIVVLEDCSSAMASPKVDSDTHAEVMLDYFKFKIAFVANSEDLRFTSARSIQKTEPADRSNAEDGALRP